MKQPESLDPEEIEKHLADFDADNPNNHLDIYHDAVKMLAWLRFVDDVFDKIKLQLNRVFVREDENPPIESNSELVSSDDRRGGMH